MSLLLKNIKYLIQTDSYNKTKVCGSEMKKLPFIENAFLFIENDKISSFGSMNDMPPINALKVIDAKGKSVMPCWVDSHTHLVFAGSREQEFVDRINGLSYEEIALRGGGILNSANRLRNASEDELFESAFKRLDEIIRMGTGAVEIKSGYGLSLDSELKILRVIKRLKEKSPIPIKATFLGAHAVPVEFKNNKSAYIDLIINEMLPAIAKENLADYCDVFCERNYFTKEETIHILNAAAKFGIKAKVHAEQLSNSGGVEAGVACNAISVDHLEYVEEKDIAVLKDSATMPTILPGAAFFLSLPYPPVRKMIDAGLPLAIASDYNPGSSPCGNMHFMVSVACIQYKMTPEEAINAATINSAYAMDLSNDVGTIKVGKKANVIITKEIPGYNFIPYAFAGNIIDSVIINGEIYS
ncbi:MAG: imidazolonepropionase [Bacteroidia bacterium]